MARDIDRELALQSERMQRLPATPAERAAAGRRRQRRIARVGRKLTRIAAMLLLVWGAVLVWGLAATPIGTSALLLLVMLSVVLGTLLLVFPRDTAPAAETIAATAPALLPARTDAWLDARRRDLPRLAAPAVDAISARLATLQPQLDKVPANDPLAQDLSRLLGKHLPELVERYERVPPEQRLQPAQPGGPTIERQLVDGLGLVEAELARVSDALAAGDRDAFAVQGKFLENRYGGDGVAP